MQISRVTAFVMVCVVNLPIAGAADIKHVACATAAVRTAAVGHGPTLHLHFPRPGVSLSRGQHSAIAKSAQPLARMPEPVRPTVIYQANIQRVLAVSQGEQFADQIIDAIYWFGTKVKIN